jgi:DDE superfamily endonuclease
LARAAKATVQRILTQQALRRDPDFEAKRREFLLLVYQEVMLQNQRDGASEVPPSVITVSVEEKPCLQALANTAPGQSPVAGQHSTVRRDHEYGGLRTASILAALDLQTGHVTARVERRHRSRELIALLQHLDRYYPPTCILRMVLDNHSAHLSRETQAYKQVGARLWKTPFLSTDYGIHIPLADF